MDDPPNSLLSKGSQAHRSTCSQAKLSSVIEGRPVVLAGVGACLVVSSSLNGRVLNGPVGTLTHAPCSLGVTVVE